MNGSLSPISVSMLAEAWLLSLLVLSCLISTPRKGLWEILTVGKNVQPQNQIFHSTSTYITAGLYRYLYELSEIFFSFLSVITWHLILKLAHRILSQGSITACE